MEQGEISIFPEETVVYATFWQRFAAAFIDGMILLIPNLLIGKFIGGDRFFYDLMENNVQASSVIGQALQAALALFYSAAMESGNAQATVGKQALGIRVTSTAGERITFSNALGRNAGKWVSDIILLFGYFMMLWDERNQALHDRMAGTLVVKKQASS